MPDKKRIALITTWFPPQQSVATNRMVAFAEYLSEHFEIEVFALDERGHTASWKPGVTVHYAPSAALLRRLKSDPKDSKWKHRFKTLLRVLVGKVVKNPLKSWQEKTLRQLSQRHAEQPFDAIISSYAPQEAHLVAIAFCKQFPDVPWVADMRDEMSHNPNLNESQQQHMRAIEHDVNRYAKAITSVSLPIVEGFRQLCPDVPYVREIRNGFNHDFRRNTNEPAKNPVFRMGYFGSFYGTRKPNVLFEALEQLLHEKEGFDFVFETVGAHHNFAIPAALADKVNVLPGLPYNEAIRAMAAMDINVQLHPRSEMKGVFTGKLFDYISVQKPVLALVDSEDVAAQLVREMNAGYVAECLDVAENKQRIAAAYDDWKQGVIRFASNEDVESLHRRYQVDKLRQLLEQLLMP